MKSWSRRHVRRSLFTWVTLVALVGLPVLLIGSAGTTSMQRVTTNFLILAALVVGLQTFVGNSGIVSFGHVAFFGVGAYAAALLTIPPEIKAFALEGLPDWLAAAEVGPVPAVIAGGTTAVAVALVTGAALTRMQETAMAMATLALLVMMHTVFANWDQITRGTIGIFGIPRSVTLLTAYGGLIVFTGVALAFKVSPVGVSLRAARDDPVAARSLGVNVHRVRLAGWTMSALLMGAGGALWAQNSLAFGPDQFFFSQTFTLLSMLVIGGIASVSGAVAGAAIVTVVGELLRNLEGGMSLGPIDVPAIQGAVQLAIAFLIMLILIFRPQGLFGRHEVSAPTRLIERVRRG